MLYSSTKNNQMVKRNYLTFSLKGIAEVGIYKRKQESKKERNTLSTKKKRKKTHSRLRKKERKQELDQEKRK